MDEKSEPKPQKLKSSKASVLQSPRFQALLQTGVSVATTLGAVALLGIKRPPGFGE